MNSYVVLGKPLYVETPLWGDVEPMRVSVTVDDAKRVDTGLTDAMGNPIYRVQEAVGFHKPRGR